MTRLCYKCVYELDQCNSFLQKYKRTFRARVQKGQHQKYCSLCLEPARKGYIFDLSKDNNSLHDPFDKIQKVLEDNFEAPRRECKLICLNCRYTLDILSDLKSVFQETKIKLKNFTDEEIDYLNFPKTKTTVVSRKTTITESTSVNLAYSLDSDADSNIMARGKTRFTKLNNNKRLTKSKLRICDKCHSSVENGSDMYRFHRTGLTVCKSCWITMDLSTRSAKRRIRQNSAETKLCSVFLKDVLTDAAFKEQKVYKVEQDNEGNKIYIITDESSESDSKPRRNSPRSKAASNSTDSDAAKQGQKRSARNAKSNGTDSDEKPNKKLKSEEKESELDPEESVLKKNTIVQQSNDLPIMSVKRSLRKYNTINRPDSDTTIQTTLKRSYNITTRRAKTSVSSVSDMELEQKNSRKKLRTILRGIATSRAIHISDESSSNDDGVSKRKRFRVASVSPTLTKADNKKENVQRIRSSSTSGNETTSSSKTTTRRQGRSKVSFASSNEISKKPQSGDESDKASSDEQKEYICGQCGSSYINKLEGMTHKLTHFKQPELKLHKVSFESTINETENTSNSQTVDEHNEEQSDTILINVEDDEEDGILDVEGDSDVRNDITTIATVHNSEDQECTEKDTEDAVETHPVSEQCDHDQEISVTDSLTCTSQTKEDKESNIEETESLVQEDEARLSESIDRRSNDSPGLIRNIRIDSNDSCKEDKDNYTLVDEEDAVLDDTENLDVSNEKLKSQPELVEETKTQDENEKEVVQSEDKETEVEEKNVQKEEQEESVEKKEEVVQIENNDEAEQIENNDEAEQNEKTSEEVQKKNGDKEEMREISIEVETDNSTKKDQDQTNVNDDLVDLAVDVDECDVSKKEESSAKLEEKDMESETDIIIVDSGSSENSHEQDLPPCSDTVNVCHNGKDDETEKEITNGSKDDVIVDTVELNEVAEENGIEEVEKDLSTSATDAIEVTGSNLEEDVSQHEKSKDSETVAVEVLKEVFDLATAEVQKRHDSNEIEDDDNGDAETLENICREIHKSSDMPSLN